MPTKPDHSPANDVVPTIPTPDDFRAAVRHVLIRDHGMPELLADEVLDNDASFLENRRLSHGKHKNVVLDTADKFAFEPPSGAQWIRVDKGERVAEQGQLILDVSNSAKHYLDELVQLGLHGADHAAVANTLFYRGLEAVLPVLASAARRLK